MKNILMIVFILFAGSQVVAQEENPLDENKVYSVVQKKAEPKEGMDEFLRTFANEFNTLVIPPKFDEISFKFKFVVEKDGTFSNVEIGENPHAFAYIQEIIRVLDIMPAWKPAEIKDEIVRSYYTIPIKLRFPMRNVDKALLDKAILERTISNEYFEFECNCELINNSTNNYNKVKEFVYRTLDNDIFYSITLKEIVLNNAEHHFNIIKTDAEKRKTIIKEIDYNNYKALESNFAVNARENTYYNNTLYFVKDKYLINITVISINEQISKFNFADLKQTFKLKL